MHVKSTNAQKTDAENPIEVRNKQKKVWLYGRLDAWLIVYRHVPMAALHILFLLIFSP